MVKKAALVGIFIIMFAPIYFMLVGSFQDIKGIMRMPPALLPTNFTWLNYTSILRWPISAWLTNTIVVTGTIVVASISLCASAGYAFAFYKWRFKNLLWGLLLVGIMIPRISIIIPTFVIVQKLGISGTIVAAVLPVFYYPVGMYLARIYFETIPISLLESARLDGANELQILIKIVTPMSKPIITCLALFSAINALQDYLWQMLVLQDELRQTLLVGMIKSVSVKGGIWGEGLNPIGRSLAVGVVLLIPLVVVFLVSNRYFTQSLGGAIKE